MLRVEYVSRGRLLWPAALVGWTLLTWVTRLPLAWGDDELSTGGKVLATLPVAVFVALAVAAGLALAADPAATGRRARFAVRLLGGWSIGYWAVRLPLIAVNDHPVAFVAAHAALALVAVGLGVAAIRASSTAPMRSSVAA